MAKLNTYYTVPPTLDDILFGTDNTIPSRTRNFTVAGLFALYNTTYNVIPPTLQIVTTNGAITTNTVYLNGGALSNSINEQAIFQSDSISTVNLNSGSGASIDSTGKVALSPDGLVSTIFASDNITQDITLQAPNKTAGSYTLATTDDVPTKTSDLVNDGENGVDPFITAADIPPVTGFVPYTGATDDVNLGTHDLTATQGTFATSGNPDTLTVNHSSGSGKALTITKGGAGEGIYVNKTSGSGNAVTIVGDLEATNLKRTGGTSSQFLKADGSVDSNTYFELPALTSGSVLFSNGTTIAQNNTNFFWNNSSIGLCLGGTTLDSNYIFQINGGKGARISGTGSGYGYSLVRGSETAAFANNGSGSGLSSTTTLLFNTAATERIRINSSGNILINTTTDGGFKLDVNGTARVSGNATFGTLGTGTGMFWDNTNNRLGIGTSSPTTTLDVRGLITTQQATLPSFAANGSIMVGGSNVSNLAGVLMGVQIPYVTGAFGGHSIGYSNQTNPKWLIGLSRNLAQENALIYYEDSSAASARLTLFPAGNIGINTTTNAGYRLDVNGTARVQGDFNLISGNSIRFSNALGLSKTTNKMLIYGGTGSGNAGGTDIHYWNGSTYVAGLRLNNNANVLINTTTDIASSKLTIESTTQGFLPPRMTTTQKNAIATPAAGLMIYDNTLNRPCFYDGTTWITL